MEYEGKAIITHTSNDSCDLSIIIDHTSRSLSFSRSVFYTYGLRCEGDMQNILEEGMEVGVCYRISDPDLFIVAVWFGDKPDSFSDDEYSDVSSEEDTATAVYGKEGRVIAVDTDKFVVESHGYRVVVSKAVVFRDGYRVNDSATVDIGEEMMYDAVPCEAEEASYKATCAWIGQQPCVVDRFNLRSMDEPDEDVELEVLQRHGIYGTVVVIPNETVALVEVEFESYCFRVVLFRNSIKPVCDRIQDVVNVGDNLCMRLRYGFVFPVCQQWFATMAVKDGEGSLELDLSTGTGTKDDVDHVALYGSPDPLSGTISRVSYDSACINYKDFKIYVDSDNFYIDGEKSGVGDFMLRFPKENETVQFEAVPTKLREYTHEATCVWVGRKKPDVSAIASSLPPRVYPIVRENGQVFYGIVSKLCFPELAIVVIPGKFATVRINSSQFREKPFYVPEASDGLISNYVRPKDCVQFIVQFVSGWDVVRTSFSKEVWERANDRAFISRVGTPETEVQAETTRRTLVQGPTSANAKKSGSNKPRASGRPLKAFAGKTVVKNVAMKATCPPIASAKTVSRITNAKRAAANNRNAVKADRKISEENNADALNKGVAKSVRRPQRQKCKPKKVALTTEITEGIALLKISTNSPGAKLEISNQKSGKNAKRKILLGNFLENAKVSTKTANHKANNQTAKIKGAGTKAPSKNVIKNAAGNAVVAKNATSKRSTAGNGVAKTAKITQNAAGKKPTANSTAKNAPAKNSAAANANTPRASSSQSAAGNAVAKSAKATKAVSKNVVLKNAAGKVAAAKNATSKRATAGNGAAKTAKNTQNTAGSKPAANSTAKNAPAQNSAAAKANTPRASSSQSAAGDSTAKSAKATKAAAKRAAKKAAKKAKPSYAAATVATNTLNQQINAVATKTKSAKEVPPKYASHVLREECLLS